MSRDISIGIVSDIIPADSPLMSGQGPYSSCKGEFHKIFHEFRKYAQKYDFLVGNFEAVLVEIIKKASPSESAMKSPASVISVLKDIGFKYLSIANNHTMEYGKDSFRWMCAIFSQEGITTFGHRKIPYCYVHIKDLTIGLLAFSTVPAMYGAVPEYYFVDHNSLNDKQKLFEFIRKAKTECDYLFVFPHWGYEFMTFPANWQVSLARDIIDCGSDAIFGTHPHTIQTSTMINSKPVFFSLGNLLSDYFQDRLKRNIVISADIGKSSLKISGYIFSYDKDFKIYNTGTPMPNYTQISSYVRDDEYLIIANKMRIKVRRELIAHMLKNPMRWMFNFGLWKWILARGCFIILNTIKIKNDPNAVYAGPIH